MTEERELREAYETIEDLRERSITIERIKNAAKDIKADFQADANDSHSGAEAFGAALALRMLIGHFEELQKEDK